MAENIEPKTREQMYWAAMGGHEVELPEGKTRMQKFMKDAADAIGDINGDIGDINETIDIIKTAIPEAPSADGAYVLTCTVASGEATYSWVAAE